MVSFSFDKFMKGLASGTDSGLGSFAKPYVQTKTQDAYNKGVGQIQQGDWEGGLNTIGEWAPDTALTLAQAKKKSDDTFALEQMREQAQERARNTITPYQQEMLSLSRQRLAQSQSGDNDPFSSNNEFLRLLGIRNNETLWNKLPDDQKSLIDARLSYMSNAPENIYEKAYQGQKGKDIAKQEMTTAQNTLQSQQQQQNLSNAIDLVDTLPDNLFMPYADISSGIGTISKGKFGMTPEENEQYGYLERTIGTIENDLIAKARSKGQSGINTIAEIRQAAKGLQLGRGKQRLKGALQAMLEIEKRLDAMPTEMTPMSSRQNYSNVSDDEILQGLK